MNLLKPSSIPGGLRLTSALLVSASLVFGAFGASGERDANLAHCPIKGTPFRGNWADCDAPRSALDKPGWKLTFSDDFDKPRLREVFDSQFSTLNTR